MLPAGLPFPDIGTDLFSFDIGGGHIRTPLVRASLYLRYPDWLAHLFECHKPSRALDISWTAA